jgi:outer membrane protein assembly factor BamA
LDNDHVNDQNNNSHGVDLGNDHKNDHNNNPNDNMEDLGDSGHHEDAATTTLETSIELIKRNRPLLDRMGKFGKVLENLLQFGTAASEVNYPSLLPEIRLSNHPIG